MRKTDKQREIFRHAVTGPGGPRWLFSIGSTRTGKTAAVAAAHAAFTQLGSMPTQDHAIIGPNLSQIRRNIVEAPIGTLSTLRHAGHRGASLSTVGGWHVQVPRGHGRTTKIWLIGASDEKAVNRITGSTFGSVVLDELPLLPESVWNQVMARMLSVPGARGWATGNPGPTRSYVNRSILQRLDDVDGRHLKFKKADMVIPVAEVARLERGFTGHFHTRLIEGEWSDAAGRIYPEPMEVDAVPDDVIGWSLGLDWASSGVFASLLFAHVAGDPGWYLLVDERYHDGRTEGLLSEKQQTTATASWVRDRTRSMKQIPIYGDPSTSVRFKAAVGAQGFHWIDGDNSVDSGIKETAGAIQEGRVRILRGACPRLRDDLSAYTWDPKAADRGEDKPLKVGADHGPDALRYRLASDAPAFAYRVV